MDAAMDETGMPAGAFPNCQCVRHIPEEGEPFVARSSAQGFRPKLLRARWSRSAGTGPTHGLPCGG